MCLWIEIRNGSLLEPNDRKDYQKTLKKSDALIVRVNIFQNRILGSSQDNFHCGQVHWFLHVIRFWNNKM
jgi:hypothetical protein